MRRYYADIVVVGAGGAGLIAAAEACLHGGSVAVVSKGKAGRSGATVMAPGGVAAVHGLWSKDGDSKRLHEADSYHGGGWLNDQVLMGRVVDEIGDVLISLEKMGALWQRGPDGKTLLLKTDAGHSHNRSLFLEDRIGREMMKALCGELARRNVPVHDEIMLTNPVVRDGRILGALGFDVNTLEGVLFESKCLVLATGGCGMVYSNTTNPTDLTGDGFLFGLQAGARLCDMEFVQFYPLSMLFPESYRGVICATAMYSRLFNSEGERFMKRYDPARMENATRDYISRAIMHEVTQGRGSPRGGVFCDCTHNESGFFKRFLNHDYKLQLSAGVDMRKDRFEVAPSSHFMMGGLTVDSFWQSDVVGLYCVGEAAGGVHGANRISQNALSDILVSGVVAARHAAQTARKLERPFLAPGVLTKLTEEISSLVRSRDGITPSAQRAALRAVMWEKAGVLRSDASLREALRRLEELEKQPLRLGHGGSWVNREILHAFENKALFATARAIILSALARTETRGAHYRSDYPQTDEKWLKNIILTPTGGKLLVSAEDVRFSRMKKGEAIC